MPDGMQSTMLLTDRTLLNFQRCHRQVYLDWYGDRQHRTNPSDFLKKIRQDKTQYLQEVLSAQTWVQPDYPKYDWIAGAQATLDLMRQGIPLIYGGVLLTQPEPGITFVSTPDFLTRVSGVSDLGDWLYVTTDVQLSKRPKLEYQIVAVFHAQLVAATQGGWPPTSYLYLRQKGQYAVDLAKHQPKLAALLTELCQMLRHRQEPEAFIVHNRCSLCGWFEHCYSTAQSQQHLSLLPGVTPNRYPILQTHNLETVDALAATDPQELDHLTGFGHDVAGKLVNQAQATATNQPIPLGPFQNVGRLPLPTAPVELYFDIEAEPSLNLAYLHGVLLVNRQTATQTFYPLLAESPEQEQQAWQQFLDLVATYPTAPIFHFCAYEVQTINRLAQLYPTPAEVVQPLVERCVDLHAWVTQTVTLPIERYTLKRIAQWLGFEWRNAEANGAQSICWYTQWLETGDRQLLDTILEYNEDDCRATYHVKDWLVDFLDQQTLRSA